LNQIENYKASKKDLFSSWRRDWSIFHTFFYRGKVKETTQLYLERICKKLLSDLALDNYTYHWVDFQGANNFGAYSCWIALYPQNKPSHRDAHQFFIKFKPEIEVGRTSGSSI